MPIEIQIDGETPNSFWTQTTGKTLTAKLILEEEWDEGLEGLSGPISLYLLRTPADEYRELEEEIHAYERKTIKLGDLKGLIQKVDGSEATIDLEKEFYYDVFAIGSTPDGERRVCGGGRFSTIRAKKVPGMMTFDQMRLLTIEHLGITVDQAKDVETKIVPMTAWGQRGRLVIAGFKPPKNDEYGVNVYHSGYSDRSHDHSLKDTKKAFGII